MRVIVWKMADEYSETEIPESSQMLELATYSTRQKSVVWKYFGIEKNSSAATQRERSVTWKLCAQKATHSGSTTNLKNHVKTNH